MREIRGIEFPDSIADVVQQLIDRMEEKIGTSHLFSSKKHFGLSLHCVCRTNRKARTKRHSAYSYLFRQRKTEH